MKSLAIISNQAFSLVNFRGSLISVLKRENIRVYALAPDYNDVIRQQILALGALPVDFKISRTGMNPLRDFKDMLNLAVLLRSLSPDVTLGYTIKPVVYGTLAAWIARVPKRVAMIEGLGHVFTSSGVSLSWKKKWLRKVVSFLYQVALARAHRVIFLNKDDIAEFVDESLVDHAKVVLVGGIGVDLVEWLYLPPITKPVTFLLAARLLREKGIVEYAKAAKLVKAMYPDTRFILLGAVDSNPSSLSQLEVEEWVRDEVVEWHGHADVKPWIAKSSVYVLPSYREGLPRSTQEAMAMGRPIITTDVPGCRETVVNGVNGFLVPVFDVGALELALLIFVKQPELIAPMGAASRRMAEAKFDVNKINADILKIVSGSI